MTTCIVDASVAVKWFLIEPHSDAALRLRSPGYRLHAPALLDLEFHNTVAKKIRRDELSIREGREMLGAVERIPMQRHPDALLLPYAYELAVMTQRSVYDCQYLALAIQLQGRIITADSKFYDALKAGQLVEHLTWVEDLA